MAFISSLKKHASWKRAPFMAPVISEWKTSIVGCTPSNIISSYTSLNKKYLNQKGIEQQSSSNTHERKKKKKKKQSKRRAKKEMERTPSLGGDGANYSVVLGDIVGVIPFTVLFSRNSKGSTLSEKTNKRAAVTWTEMEERETYKLKTMDWDWDWEMKNFMAKKQYQWRIEGASLILKSIDGAERNGAHCVSPARFLIKTLPFLRMFRRWSWPF